MGLYSKRLRSSKLLLLSWRHQSLRLSPRPQSCQHRLLPQSCLHRLSRLLPLPHSWEQPLSWEHHWLNLCTSNYLSSTGWFDFSRVAYDYYGSPYHDHNGSPSRCFWISPRRHQLWTSTYSALVGDCKPTAVAHIGVHERCRLI